MIVEQTLYDNSKNIRVEQHINSETNLLEGEYKKFKFDELVLVLNYTNGKLNGRCIRYNLDTIDYIYYDLGSKLTSVSYQRIGDDIGEMLSEMTYKNNDINTVTIYKNNQKSSYSLYHNKTHYTLQKFTANKLTKQVTVNNGKKYILDFDAFGKIESYKITDGEMLSNYHVHTNKLFSKDLNISRHSVIDADKNEIFIKFNHSDFIFENDLEIKSLRNLFLKHVIEFDNKLISLDTIIRMNRNKMIVEATQFEYDGFHIFVLYNNNFPFELVVTKNKEKHTLLLDKKFNLKVLIIFLKGLSIKDIKSILKLINYESVNLKITDSINQYKNAESIFINNLINNENFTII